MDLTNQFAVVEDIDDGITNEDVYRAEHQADETPRAKTRYRTAGAKLIEAHVAITNTLKDAEIQALVADLGYDATRMQEGRALFERCSELHGEQQGKYGEQYASTDGVNKEWGAANEVYMKTLKIARLVLKDDPAATAALKLKGGRAKNFPDWSVQVLDFYNNLLKQAEWIRPFERFNHSRARLEAERTTMHDVMALNAEQEMRKGFAQDTTKIRDRSMDDLDQWMKEFKTMARIALKDRPQWLEKIGLGAV